MVSLKEAPRDLSQDLLSPEAKEVAQSLIPPEFNDEHELMAGNFSVYLIGSSPSVPVHFNSPKMIETWTQLPQRSYFENMYAQFSEGIPGVVINLEERRIFVDPSLITEDETSRVNADWLIVFEGIDPETGDAPTPQRVEEALSRYAVSKEYAFGLHCLKDLRIGETAAGVKG